MTSFTVSYATLDLQKNIKKYTLTHDFTEYMLLNRPLKNLAKLIG